MTPQEEREIALDYAKRIAALFNEIEGSEEHGIIVELEGNSLALDGKYGIQARVEDSGNLVWRVES